MSATGALRESSSVNVLVSADMDRLDTVTTQGADNLKRINRLLVSR